MATSATKHLDSNGDPTTLQVEEIRKSTDRENIVKTHSSTIILMRSLRDAEVSYREYKQHWGLERRSLHLQDSEKAYPNVELTSQNMVDIETLSKNAGKVLEGKFLLCRTILPSCLLNGVLTVADDHRQKQAVTLDLRNFFICDLNAVDCSQLLPSGSFLAIKNPCLKRKVTTTGLYAVQCLNSPSQVEMLSYKAVKNMLPDIKWHWGEDFLPSHKIQNPSFWPKLEGTERQAGEAVKKMGNTAFVEKRFAEAIRWYNIALDYDNDRDFAVDVLSNRAAAFLNLRCYYRALDDSNKVLEKNAAHVKAVYRKTKSLIGLRMFEEAANFISEKMATFKELMTNQI